MSKTSRKVITSLGVILVISGIVITTASVWDSTIGNQIEAAEQTRISEEIFDREILITDTDESESNMTVAEPQIMDGSNGLEYGQVFAKLYVPRFGADYVRIIAEGTSSGVLNKAMGHYASTSLPWEEGNFAVAAHRTTRGASLMDIDKLVSGDRLFVETVDAYYVYEHVNTVIVPPTESGVLTPNPPSFKGSEGDSLLTLTSCHPKYSDAKRIIAFNKLVGTYPKEVYTLEEVQKLK